MSKIAVCIVFFSVYILLLTLPKIRHFIALGASVLYVIFGVLTTGEALDAINWNVLLMLVGTMGTVDLFIRSHMPTRIADHLVERIPDAKMLIIVMALFAGIVSAFLDNVATVLMLAPVGIEIAKKLEISPVNPILAIAVSSNLQGAATLVGDTTSILLAGKLNMDFMDFFWYMGKPGMFFVVELGACVTIPVMLILFRKENKKIHIHNMTVVEDYLPTIMLLGTILSLILASFFTNKPEITNGLLCVGIFMVGFVIELSKEKNMELAKSVFAGLDYSTLLLLGSLFVILRAVEKVGLINDISALISRSGGGNLFLTYTVIVWASVLISAFVDNIPYTAAMLPIVGIVSEALQVQPALLSFGLLTGATLGGNLTPIGASANITAAGILKKNGYSVSAKQFMKIGVPFTLAAVITGYIFVWLFYSNLI